MIQKPSIHKINSRKYPWFPAPTQLLIQGQWWSNTYVHLSQCSQCFDRIGFGISHTGQTLNAGVSYKISTSLIPSGFIQYPGLLSQTKVKKIISNKKTLIYATIHGAYLKGKIKVNVLSSPPSKKNMKRNRKCLFLVGFALNIPVFITFS